LLTFVVTMLIFTSPGTDPNHLLELQVAAILVVGRCLEAPWFRSSRVLLWAIILAALLWGVQGLAMRGWTRALSAEQLSAALPPDLHLLSEDASVPVLLGQRPIVMDPFAFRVLAERGLVDDGDLASRLDQRQFDVIVMMGRVDIEGESLCPRLHFGQLVTSAVKRNYRFDRQVGGYSVYSRR
jgi:hypothetical protein